MDILEVSRRCHRINKWWLCDNIQDCCVWGLEVTGRRLLATGGLCRLTLARLRSRCRWTHSTHSVGQSTSAELGSADHRQAGALRMFTTRGERSNLWHHLGRRPQGMAPLLLVVIVIINGWFVSLSINYRYILRKLQASSPLHCLSTEQFLISQQTK